MAISSSDVSRIGSYERQSRLEFPAERPLNVNEMLPTVKGATFGRLNGDWMEHPKMIVFLIISGFCVLCGPLLSLRRRSNFALSCRRTMKTIQRTFVINMETSWRAPTGKLIKIYNGSAQAVYLGFPRFHAFARSTQPSRK